MTGLLRVGLPIAVAIKRQKRGDYSYFVAE